MSTSRVFALVSGLLATAGLSARAHASILPPNNLHLQDDVRIFANITPEEFNAIINRAIDLYRPLAAIHGATLKSNNLWENSTVNASAEQRGNEWIINMYGGLARRQEVTPDGFAMVVCHELGHHFGGFAFYGNTDWAASEGQSDYFATQACARKLWGAEGDVNTRARADVTEFEKSRCDASWTKTPDRDLCYRNVAAGKSLATLLSALRNGGVPRTETPDSKQVTRTSTGHPEAQCRLDTYFAGALCTVGFDERIIPGRKHPEGQLSLGAERVAGSSSCMNAYGYDAGVRPRCWYGPQLQFEALQLADVGVEERSGNGDGVIDPGESIGLGIALANRTRSATTNVRANISTSHPDVTVAAAQAAYPDIAAGESERNLEPFVVNVGANAVCGSAFDVKVSAASAQGSAQFTKALTIGRFETRALGSATPQADIPDADPVGITSAITSPLDGNAQSVLVKVAITHAYPTDLKIVLVDPEGRSFPLYGRNVSPLAGALKRRDRADRGVRAGIDQVFEVKADRLKLAGTWTLQVSDRVRRDVGTLDSWGLETKRAVCTPQVSVARHSLPR